MLDNTSIKIRFCGFGGQGIVLSGYIYGAAAALDGHKVLQTQSYGSEARGGLCRSDVIVSKGDIFDLVPTRFDVLVTMSQASHDAYLPALREDGILVFDKDLVSPGTHGSYKPHGIKATDIAYKSFGVKIMANIVMMGVLCAALRTVSPESVKRTILGHMSGEAGELNIRAFEEGYRIGEAGVG